MNHNRIAILTLLLYRHKLPKDSVAMTYRELIDVIVKNSGETFFAKDVIEKVNRFDLEDQHELADKILLNDLELLRNEKGYIERLMMAKRFYGNS